MGSKIRMLIVISPTEPEPLVVH